MNKISNGTLLSVIIGFGVLITAINTVILFNASDSNDPDEITHSESVTLLTEQLDELIDTNNQIMAYLNLSVPTDMDTRMDTLVGMNRRIGDMVDSIGQMTYNLQKIILPIFEDINEELPTTNKALN